MLLSFKNRAAIIRAWAINLIMFTAVLAMSAGCKTNADTRATMQAQSMTTMGTNTAPQSESIVLREGDVLKITFPSVPNLNSPATAIRRDGKIALTLVGEVQAAGKTPEELKADLLKAYASQTESKELLVEVLSSAFPIFVTGAVLKPQKVTSDHPMTALEAIMECGGPEYTRANLKSVRVLRKDGDHLKKFNVNLQEQLDAVGKPFYLQPYDIIYVKEKFTWF